VGVQVKLWNLLRTRTIPERFCGGDSPRRGAISSVCTFLWIKTGMESTEPKNKKMAYLPKCKRTVSIKRNVQWQFARSATSLCVEENDCTDTTVQQVSK